MYSADLWLIMALPEMTLEQVDTLFAMFLSKHFGLVVLFTLSVSCSLVLFAQGNKKPISSFYSILRPIGEPDFE